MKKYILGNWKQNGDADLVKQMIAALQQLASEQLVAIFPPEVYLTTAKKAYEQSLRDGAARDHFKEIRLWLD